MSAAGAKGQLPDDKEALAQYLCDITGEEKCDPDKGKFCDDDATCDIDTKICTTAGLKSIVIAGKKVYGSDDAIAALKKKLVKPPPVPPKPAGKPLPVPPKPEAPKIVPPVIPPPEKIKPVEGTEIKTKILQDKDIEEIITKISEEAPTEISDLTATQTAVLKCLGLVAK